MTTTYFVVPAGIDDPAHPSGGNVYDRRISRGLVALGWTVTELPIPGSWPTADASARSVLLQMVSTVPDGAVLVVDGLIASASPAVLVPAADRLQLVVLMHLPFGAAGAPDRDEGAVLTAAAAIITTSEWTRHLLREVYLLVPQRVWVAEPGVEPVECRAPTPSGRALLCVAAVVPHKGQDLLVEALAATGDLDWCCTLVGALDLDPAFVQHLRIRSRTAGIERRIRFPGPLTGSDLDAAYAAADVVVSASRAETYGMVIAEALARGIPVVATDVGGVPAVLGCAPGGHRPGKLVPAGDATALAAALRSWLTDPELRHDLRASALHRRSELTTWAVTAGRIAVVLTEVAT